MGGDCGCFRSMGDNVVSSFIISLTSPELKSDISLSPTGEYWGAGSGVGTGGSDKNESADLYVICFGIEREGGYELIMSCLSRFMKVGD